MVWEQDWARGCLLRNTMKAHGPPNYYNYSLIVDAFFWGGGGGDFANYTAFAYLDTCWSMRKYLTLVYVN